MQISPLYANIGASVASINWNKPQVPVRTTQTVDAAKELPWLKDKTLAMALNQLNDLQFSQDDLKYLQNMGVKPPFKSGKEAVDYIKKNNIRMMFDKPSEEGIHAQYDFSRNMMIINDRYRKMENFPVILAISEAILHEACHAKDNDGDSSIQEELDSLGMNSAAHRAYLMKYGDLFSESDAPIVKDGVSIYAKMFFEPDPEKLSLVARMRNKYGYLPVGDNKHPAGMLAKNIKNV